jgi:uncharacterized protein YdeI (YjbR/CyaY-like superfamily)
MATDPRIDAYIAKTAPFAQPILKHVRALVHKALPGAEETIKWSMPHFTVGGKNVAGMAAFKAHCAFMIHGDGRQGEAMGQYGKIAAMADLPSDAELIANLTAALERVQTAGTALKPRSPKAPKAPKAEIAMPDEFAAALAKVPVANAAFAAFAPSHRREYLEWVVEAKRAETRDKRIAQAVEWIAEGKKRNWKYENC